VRSTNPKSEKPKSESPPAFLPFIGFVRRYLSAWPILIACLIGPISKYFHLIPIYKAHENLATGVVSVYGFLFAAALFRYQPPLSRRSKVWKLVPLILILLSVLSLVLYISVIQDSVRREADMAGRLGVIPSQLSYEEILARTSFPNIPRGNILLTTYLVSFFGAETALITFALLEYQTAQSKRSRVKQRT
jgi:hypothetical protein